MGKMSGKKKKTYLRDINPILTCPLCRGYLIDATTIVECSHSFCRSCILKQLRLDARCPCCNYLLNTAKPNIKADKALQDIVYKLVPGLYQKEMRIRREFYSKHPDHADCATPEQRGEDVSGRLIFTPEDAISLSLEYISPNTDPLSLLNSSVDAPVIEKVKDEEDGETDQEKKTTNGMTKRYLQCPALVTIAHLKKFLALKYGVDVGRYNIDICYRRAALPEHWTLMDVAYTFAWKRNAPIRFFYRITQEDQQLEAPTDARASTPGLGATQPVNEEPIYIPAKHEDSDTEELEKDDSSLSGSGGNSDTEDLSDKDTKEDDSEDNELPESETLSSAGARIKNPEDVEDSELVKRVKTPLKISKNVKGVYEIMRNPVVAVRDCVDDNKSVPKQPAKFSVVSIEDSSQSNKVKITLKQCSPDGNSTASNKKPKILDSILLCNPKNSDDRHNNNNNNKINNNIGSKQQERNESTANVSDNENISNNNNNSKPLLKIAGKKSQVEPSNKKPTTQIKISAKQQQTNNSKSAPELNGKVSNNCAVNVSNGPTYYNGTAAPRNLTPILPKTNGGDSPLKISAKQVNNRVSTSITPVIRLSEYRQNLNNIKELEAAKKNTEQPIDVYAFPNEPSTPPPTPIHVSPGAVKRKCPPGVPIAELRKRQTQGYIKKKGVPMDPNKLSAIKNQNCTGNTAPSWFNRSPANSPAKSNSGITRVISGATSGGNSMVTSTSSKNTTAANGNILSTDTRSLLDGCGLNIPASLSITLTPSKSPAASGAEMNSIQAQRDSKNFNSKLSPSITLNDKSVDSGVLKAIKTGQMKICPETKSKAIKTKATHSPDKQPPAKRKREDPRKYLDQIGPDTDPLRFALPPEKFKPIKSKPKRQTSPKSASHEDYRNGQIVTLSGGQKFFRTAPGSRTPAVHMITDMPTRAPVYAPCFPSNTQSQQRPLKSFSAAFPSLQSLYAFSQSQNMDQFQVSSNFRTPIAPKESSNPPVSSSSAGKSHISAQCPPSKPSRGSGGLVIPMAKQSANSQARKSPTMNNTVNNSNGEMSTTTGDNPSSDPSNNRMDLEVSKASSKSQFQCSMDDEHSQGSASPRVSSSAPSPPPIISEIKQTPKTTCRLSSSLSSSAMEVTSTKPESPDSSSAISESSGNLVDSTKTVEKSNGEIHVNTALKEAKSSEGKPKIINDQILSKMDMNGEAVDEKKMEAPEALKKQILAAVQTHNWNSAETNRLSNILKNLSQVQKAVEQK